MADKAKRRATYADIEAAPPHLVAEIIDGELMMRRGGLISISAARTAIMSALGARPISSCEGRSFAIGRPEIHHGGNVVVPDIAAWPEKQLRNHVDCTWPDVPAPFWVCDVLGKETQSMICRARQRIYAEAGVRWLWVVDPWKPRLETFALTDDAWAQIGTWNSDDTVRAPPFDAIEFSLADLWPLDKPLGFHEDPQALYAGDR